MKKREQVVLKLDRLSVPEKIEKARVIKDSMAGNPNFPSPNPSMATLQERTNFLESAYIAAQKGGDDETSIMHEKEDFLDKLLTKLGHYVEDIANDYPESAESIILSAGMDTKKTAEHTARVFGVKNTDTPGEVEMVTKYLRGKGFVWQYNPTPSDPATWVYADVTSIAKFIFGGLTSGIRYGFRVAVAGRNGKGAWSNVIEMVVM